MAEQVLAELSVKIDADIKGLKAGLGKANKQVGGFAAGIKKHSKGIGMAMTAMGGAILAAGILSIKTYAKMGDEVAKMARKTGFSTETLSEFRHAAELSGTSLGSLEKAVKRMAGTILDAQDGLETYVRAFQHIGIEVQELEGLNPEEQFLKIAFAIAAVEDPTKRTALAMDIFGRAGTDLIPMFDQGVEGLQKMRDEAHKLGIVFDLEAARKAEDFTDALHRMEQAINGLKMAIAENLMPTLEPLIDVIKVTISFMGQWMKQNPELARLITLATMAIGVLLVILGPLMMMMPGLIAAWPALGGVLAALTGPIAIVVAAIGVLIAIGFVVWQNWEMFSAHLLDIWNTLKTWAITTFNSIKITVQNAINFIIAQINNLISFLNMIPGVNIGGIAPVTFGTSPREGHVGGARTPTIPLGGGIGGGVVVNVAGSVVTERDLQQSIREAMLDVKNRNTTTGF